ncbi:DUF4386 domain-containing protein [Limnovirga soli]|uniref:DUF4386 family protein n=1 Tax=Limnovirga soli TaxID=2656915 RepID=A0A8J8FDT9_9BACT|nr:DUF4386 domain-containing protein [Limnovirga soli]NNV54106.1 DUF4386 family protein [Limnovirga soli]
MISNKNLARIAGLLYLIVIATGLFAEVFVRQAFNVSGDALKTANNIQSSETLFRLGIVADIVNFIFGLPCVLIIYFLFKRINKFLLQLALLFVIVQTAIIGVNLLHQTTPLLMLGNSAYLQTFQPSQLATLSQLSLNIQGVGYAIGLVFFGCYCLLVGYVIFNSKIVPKLLGILYMISGIGYLINSFTMLLSKGFANPIFSYVAIPIFIGELAFCLWLLIKGIDNSEVFNPND